MRIAFDQIEIEVNYLGYLAPKPSWYIGPHSHQQYEMHFITKGNGVNKLESGQLEFYRNVVYMAPPGEIHEQLSDFKDPMEIYYVPFSTSGLQQNLPRIYDCYPLFQNEIQTIRQLQENLGAHHLFLVQMRLIELIWNILSPSLDRVKNIEQGHLPDANSVYTSAQQIVEKAIVYIHTHKLENPGIEDIAANCHISSRQLSRVFAQAMHSTIHAFIQHERYQWACRELQQTDKTIEQISEDLHLGSKQYFSSWFKSFSLKSPREYRRNN